MTSALRSPSAHVVGNALFLPNGSRVFELDDETASEIDALLDCGDEAAIDERLRALGVDVPPLIDDAPVVSPPLRALSLAVAQKCNLGCTYCYAQQGEFGGAAKNMPLEIALQSVELLFRDAAAGERVNLAFLGGEPLINRNVIRAATERAVELGRERGVPVTFSITTNGTLLEPHDGEFFERHGFAVTISIDGTAEAHDRQRPFKGGSGSFARIMERAAPLLRIQRQMQVSARVTVTPHNLDLRRTLDELLSLGFHSAGFSPMLASPTGNDEMDAEALALMLDAMIDCGREFERRVVAGLRFPFLNMVNAMREIHRGTHRPYPCGAGAGYLGVSADGDLAACHRFVGDAVAAMGSVESIDRDAQNQWLAARHVHQQEPCRSCWARYLCGGGCHHEVLARGRTACDYVRGWLHYCIGAYTRLIDARPEWFGAP
jgi:uncharacterized protein